MYKIIDNFLDQSDADALEEHITGNDFSWFYIGNTVKQHREGESQKYMPTIAMRHFFYWNNQVNSSEFTQLPPFFQKLNQIYNGQPINIIGIVANLLFPNDSLIGKSDIPHADNTTKNGYTAIYYINDCDGDTVLYNELAPEGVPDNQLVKYDVTEMVRITPKKNRMVIFNNRHYHSAPSSASKARFVINFNYWIGQ